MLKEIREEKHLNLLQEGLQALNCLVALVKRIIDIIIPVPQILVALLSLLFCL